MFEQDDDGKKILNSYFHSASTSNKKILPVDIANDSIVDLQLVNKKVNIFTRKNNKPKKEKFTVFTPSLPLAPANGCEAEVPADFLNVFNAPHTGKYYKSKAYEQFTRLKSHQYRVFHRSLQDVPDCGSEIGQKLATCSRTLTSESKVARKKRKFVSEFISDVPKDLAVQFLDESLFALAEEIDKNFNLRNCIACFENRGCTYLICPTGELMDYLAVKEVVTCSEKEYGSQGFQMISLRPVTAVHIGETLKEVSITEDTMIHVRCNCQYQVFGVSASTDSIELVQKFVYKFDQYVHNIGASQNNFREFFVVAVDGSVFQFDGSSPNSPSKTLAASSDGSKVATPWHTCTYGTSRETCLVLNENTLSFYDFRCRDPTAKTYFNIACEYVNTETKTLTPILKWNPMNCHQYFLVTDQSILLNDERYLKTPVLQCNHYLKSSPRHLQTLYDVQRDRDSMLLCIATYRSSDSVLYQLHCNGIQEVSLGNGPLLSMARPVTITQPLYLLSQYNDWKTYVPAWELTLSRVQNRLAQPVIGVDLSPCTSDKASKTINVIQQTLCGDLYFQQILSTRHAEDEEEEDLRTSFRNFNADNSLFTTESLTKKESDRHLVLIDDAASRCREWIDSVTKMANEKKTDIASEKMSEISSTCCRPCSLHDHEISTKDVQLIWGRVKNVLEEMEPCSLSTLGDDKSNIHQLKKSETDSYMDATQDILHADILDTDINMNAQTYDNQISNCVDSQVSENNKSEATADHCNGFSNRTLCFCKDCGRKLYANLLKTRNGGGILTRSKLNLPPFSLPLKTVEILDDVERSGKPLNQLLDAQWNEDEYVPLDKFATNVKFYEYPDFVPSP